jgi:hypothetical protein
MAYSDFTLDGALSELGLTAEVTNLFPDLVAIEVPGWLRDQLDRNMQTPLVSEKARNELIVMPVLVACRELTGRVFSIFSGKSLNVDSAKGLIGECDFILARSPPIPALQAPIVNIVEAKRGDIEEALGQCVAQMVGAKLYNERAGKPISPMFGCVTTGEDWQFLRLEGSQLVIDEHRYYLSNLGAIIAAFQVMVR